MSRRLTLVIHSLAQGGAERDMAHLARCWADRGDDVCLVTLDSVQQDSFPLGENIDRVGLGLVGESRNFLHALRNNRQRIRALHDVLKSRSPSTIVSFVDQMNVLTIKAARGLDDPVIVSERIDPRHHRLGRVWKWLRRSTYPHCTSQVVLTRPVREWCRQLAPHRPVHVVPNPARRPEIGQAASTPRPDLGHTAPDARTLIAIGRLHPQKGFDRLIPVFARLSTLHPDWHLVILGEGEQRAELEALVTTFALDDRVHLPGWIPDVADELSRADLFVLPSRFEGFGNVVAEALACGVPVVTFDCPSGPGEIVRHDIDSLVVPPDDLDGLESALSQLMTDDQLRQQMADRAPEVLDRFSESRFLAQWDAVLDGDSEEAVDRLLEQSP